MREIKFRGWSNDLMEYRQFNDINTNRGLGMGFEVVNGIGGKATTIYQSINDVVEQYTGLKDKNGKEIYEGSLVKYTEDGDSFISEVKYFGNDDYPAFDIEAPSAFYFESNVLSSGVANNCLEVVGNIHENPELLEVSE